MSEVYYILYCEFAGHYIYEEREDVWQYTSQDTALRFPDFASAKQVKKQLEQQGFHTLTIYKMRQTNTIIKKFGGDHGDH